MAAVSSVTVSTRRSVGGGLRADAGSVVFERQVEERGSGGHRLCVGSSRFSRSIARRLPVAASAVDDDRVEPAGAGRGLELRGHAVEEPAERRLGRRRR